MPRVNRFTVEFPVAAVNKKVTTYRASFSHEHDEDRVTGVPTGTIQFRGDRNDLLIKHVTTCSLAPVTAKTPEEVVEGVSWCSAHDVYDWRRGNKIALQRALARMNIKPGDPWFGKFMSSYFHELRVQDYGDQSDNYAKFGDERGNR